MRVNLGKRQQPAIEGGEALVDTPFNFLHSDEIWKGERFLDET
jgi:hypothetical protein